MNKFALFAITGILLVTLSGCSHLSANGLYWGDYSKTLYKTKKTPTASTVKAHQAELHSIIDTSTKRALKVPPGIYAELGKLYLDQGKAEEAISYFNEEAKAYPESKNLMANLIEKVQ